MSWPVPGRRKPCGAWQKEIPDLRIVEFSGRRHVQPARGLERAADRTVAIDSMPGEHCHAVRPFRCRHAQLEARTAGRLGLGEHPMPNLQRGSALSSNASSATVRWPDWRTAISAMCGVSSRPTSRKFLGEIETYAAQTAQAFQLADRPSGIDWRLIAAIAYHESHWDPNATSSDRRARHHDAHRGNRRPPRRRLTGWIPARASWPARATSICCGKCSRPTSEEPDRTWLALASYNIGPGHFNAARTLAKQLGADQRPGTK
jgi:membrane-bound lytic murein transglycosylase F